MRLERMGCGWLDVIDRKWVSTFRGVNLYRNMEVSAEYFVYLALLVSENVMNLLHLVSNSLFTMSPANVMWSFSKA